MAQCSPTNQLPDLAHQPPDMTVFSAPTVTQVAPANVPNNVKTTLTLTGTNFRAGATVQIGGVACTQVSVVSPTQLTCTYPGKAMTCAGHSIVVTHPDDQKSGTLPAAMGLGIRSAALFATPVHYGVRTDPYSVAVGNANGNNALPTSAGEQPLVGDPPMDPVTVPSEPIVPKHNHEDRRRADSAPSKKRRTAVGYVRVS